jgi:chromosomal replication initiation ATPase DnaA
MKERIDAIIVMCCLEFEITPVMFFSNSRKREVYTARTVAAVMLHAYVHMSHGEIADLLKRERSTITYAINYASAKVRIVVITKLIIKKYARMFKEEIKQLF